MKRLYFKLLILLCSSLFLAHAAQAYEKAELALPSGNEILLTKYGDEGDKLILWIPSEYGLSPELVESALNMADEGFDLWVLNLHDSYAVSPGRKSMDEFNAEDIYQLMRAAKQQGYQDIILSAASRGAILALQAGRLWQLEHSEEHEFLGYVFLHPHLIEGSVEIGDDARYLPIARTVNKPVYILQPQYSAKYLRSDQIIQQLETGGARVKVDKLLGITVGFHARPKDDLSSDDLDMRQEMGEKYQQAYQHLKQSIQPKQAVKQVQENDNKVTQKKRHSLPTAYRGNPGPPELQLKDLYGKSFDLSHYKDKVVLVNFWASWCGPCVREIPSLNRLVKKLEGKEFELLTVNINEPLEKVLQFFEELKLAHDFPVLMDTDGQASKDWKVYGYPSNFLLDKTGKIRYGYRGALEWDDDEVVEIINSLL